MTQLRREGIYIKKTESIHGIRNVVPGGRLEELGSEWRASGRFCEIEDKCWRRVTCGIEAKLCGGVLEKSVVAPVLRHPWPSLLFYYCESLSHVKERKKLFAFFTMEVEYVFLY